MSNLVEITGENFQTSVISNKGVTVVRFWATWCGPCVQMKPVYSEVADELGHKVTFGEVDIDHSPDLASLLGIRSVPTVVVFKNGEPIDGLIGMVPKSQLIDKIQAHL